MPKLERILVPMEESAASKAALQYALFLAGKVGAKVDLLHVSSPDQVRGNEDDVAIAFKGVPGSTLEHHSEAEVQKSLSAFVRAAGMGRDVRNDELEQSGDVAGFIVQHAAQQGFDLIVLGASDKGGLSRLVLGSVAQKVAQAAPCPVVTCRP